MEAINVCGRRVAIVQTYEPMKKRFIQGKHTVNPGYYTLSELN